MARHARAIAKALNLTCGSAIGDCRSHLAAPLLRLVGTRPSTAAAVNNWFATQT